MATGRVDGKMPVNNVSASLRQKRKSGRRVGLMREDHACKYHALGIVRAENIMS